MAAEQLGKSLRIAAPGAGYELGIGVCQEMKT
jgi:hypothetical protein